MPRDAARPQAPCKIKLMGTAITGFRSPPATAALTGHGVTAGGVQRVAFKTNTARRRVPDKHLPSPNVLAKMPDEHKGRDCCGGSKEWGCGKGSVAFGDGKTFVCHACLVELEMPGWALLGFANKEEMAEFGRLNALLSRETDI